MRMFQVASRRVIQVQAIYMLLFGILGKFGALFVTIPEPVIGGVFLVMFGEYVTCSCAFEIGDVSSFYRTVGDRQLYKPFTCVH